MFYTSFQQEINKVKKNYSNGSWKFSFTVTLIKQILKYM